MAYDQVTKNKVRAKYVQGLPLATAAESLDVPYQTARAWKRKASEDGDDWDIARNARRLSASGAEGLTGQILHDLAEQFEATIKAMRDAKEMPPQTKADILVRLSDAYIKTMQGAGRGNPKLNRLAVAMDVIRELVTFVAQNHPTMRADILRVVEEFGPVLSQRFSSTA